MILVDTGICFTLVIMSAMEVPDAEQWKPQLREQPPTAAIAAVPDSL